MRAPTPLILSVLGAFLLIPLTVVAQDDPTGVSDLAPEIRATAQPAEGWLGVQIRKSEGADTGVDVTRILRASPAREAGLRTGDRLVRVGEVHVTTVSAFQKKIQSHKPGETVDLHIERDGQEEAINVELAGAPDTQTLVDAEFDGRQAPDFSAKLIGDRPEDSESATVDQEHFEGKPTVIEFWASWCMPCRPLTRQLGQIQKRVGDRAHFVGLSSEKSSTIETYLDEHPPPFAMAATREEVMERFLIESYPTVFVLDADGQVAGIFVGTGHHRSIAELVDELVDE